MIVGSHSGIVSESFGESKSFNDDRCRNLDPLVHVTVTQSGVALEVFCCDMVSEVGGGCD